MKQLLSILCIAGLSILIAARPWHHVNRSMGIVTKMDSLRADSVQVAQTDSLIIDPVAVTLPQIISDSLSYTVEARTKKKAYLEEQSALLQKENQQLEASNKAKRKRLEQNLVTAKDLDRLLAKQNPKAGADAQHLGISDLETELNKRKRVDP